MTFNDSQRQARNLNALLRVSKALATEIRLDELLQVIVEEAAEVHELSPATVKRDWARARAWLFRELRPVARSTDLEESHRHVKET